MTYPFHSLTQTTTAKCAYCGRRFDACRIFYKGRADSSLLAEGTALVAETLPKRTRFIETYCSLNHAKRHKPLSLAEHTAWEQGKLSYPGVLHTKATHCTKGHILIPENIYLYAGDRTCKICNRAYHHAVHGATRLYKESA